jgi:hypothetical protein
MSKLEYSNDSWSLEIEYTGKDIGSIVDNPVRQFIRDVMALHSRIHIEKLEVKKVNEIYEYRFRTKDGRIFAQDMIFEGGQFRMRFRETSFFRDPGDIQLNIVIRRGIQSLISGNELIKIEIKFFS